MAGTFRNPAVEWFVQSFADEVALAQVRACRKGSGYELRHVHDWEKPPEELKIVSAPEARALAQFTESGVFRPLKSAPTLRQGWRILAASDDELATALDRLYPGAIPDLYSTQKAPAPVTDYPEFTNRQTGMYRITAFLKGPDAAATVRKCCAPEFCLKRRFWDVAGLAPEEARRKSVIPCLEPCAILLEFARKVVRATQRENASVEAVLPKVQPNAQSDEG